VARFHFVMALAIVGCADLTAPPSYSGSYHLARVNGSVIPVALPADTGRCTTNVHGGALDLSAGAFTLTLIISAQCPFAGDVSILELSGSVHANGQVLALTSHQPPQAASEELDMRAELHGQEVRLTWLDDRYGFKAGTYTFARTPPP
jgi:hypothetical protein